MDAKSQKNNQSKARVKRKPEEEDKSEREEEGDSDEAASSEEVESTERKKAVKPTKSDKATKSAEEASKKTSKSAKAAKQSSDDETIEELVKFFEGLVEGLSVPAENDATIMVRTFDVSDLPGEEVSDTFLHEDACKTYKDEQYGDPDDEIFNGTAGPGRSKEGVANKAEDEGCRWMSLSEIFPKDDDDEKENIDRFEKLRKALKERLGCEKARVLGGASSGAVPVFMFGPVDKAIDGKLVVLSACLVWT